MCSHFTSEIKDSHCINYIILNDLLYFGATTVRSQRLPLIFDSGKINTY